MKNNIFLRLFLLTGLAVAFYTCDKTDKYESDQPEEYMSLAPGKYILYKMDSLVYVNFNQDLITVRYQAKDVVDAPITDNQGRPSWRVIRYIRDSASTDEADWKPLTTYMVTPLGKSVEVVEENQRYVKLKLPVREGYAWKGNSYIDPESFDPGYSISSWDYTYEQVNSPFVFNDGTTIPHTITVNQRDEVLGNPENPYTYSIETFSKEVYAKNIGLIYKEFFHSEYQTFYDVYNCYYVKCVNNVCDTVTCPVNDYGCELDKLAAGYTKYCKDTTLAESYHIGYGLRLQMIEHN